MARKKKIEEPVEEEIKTSELSDELKERINEVMDVVNTTATATTSDGVEPVPTVATCSIGETVDTTRLTTIHYLKEQAIREIDRCSAYVFSGRDKALDRTQVILHRHLTKLFISLLLLFKAWVQKINN